LFCQPLRPNHQSPILNPVSALCSLPKKFFHRVLRAFAVKALSDPSPLLFPLSFFSINFFLRVLRAFAVKALSDPGRELSSTFSVLPVYN
jgi:hypothetical protein